MTKLEDLTLEVIQSKKVFSNNYKEIAEAVGLTENMLRIHIRDIKRVLRNYEYNRDNIEDIASDLNISEEVSEILLDNYCIKPIKTISKMKSLVLEGVTDVNEIAEKISRSPDWIYHLALKEKIPTTSTPIYKVKKRNPHWDKLIKEGFNQQEIGKKVGKTREWIRQYIQGSDQYEIWKNANEIRKITDRNNTNVIKLKEGRDILLGIIRQTIENRVINIPDNASPEDFADKYLGIYILKKRKVKTSIKNKFRKNDIPDIYNLFRIYKEAKDNNKRMSLEEFEKRTGISFTQVGRIFKEVGLKPMFENYSGRKTRIKF